MYKEPGYNCGYTWLNYELKSVLYATDGKTVPNPDNFISLQEPQEGIVSYHKQNLNQAMTLKVTFIALLSDQITVANSTFSIKFEAIQSNVYVAGNKAPQFLIKPQDEYVRKVDSTGNAAKINAINIGSIYDL